MHTGSRPGSGEIKSELRCPGDTDGAPGDSAASPSPQDTPAPTTHTAAMSKLWRKVMESLPKPSSLKKTASKNVSFVQNKYGDDLSKRARNLSAELGKQARERAEEAASRLAGRARALPSKAAEVGERLMIVREKHLRSCLLDCTAAQQQQVFKVRHNLSVIYVDVHRCHMGFTHGRRHTAARSQTSRSVDPPPKTIRSLSKYLSL